MARKKSKSGKKRTISPEHLAKMQEGRKRVARSRARVADLKERGISTEVPMTNSQRMLNSVRRKG